MNDKDSRKYQVLNTIATGGTAVLYKAIQTSLDRPVVIKRLHSHLIADPNFTRRFEIEAKAAASLDHENIVRIIDFGSSHDTYYIVMEYIDGVSLKDLIARRRILGEELTLLIAREICMGLDHAHQRGIIHRDIKPANIMITNEGQVKITDFGLAKLHQSQTQQTVASTLLGTPLYMSPEQAVGEAIDGRSDLFSLGTICYETITGTQPFLGDNYAVVIQNIMNGNVPPPSKIKADVSPTIDAIVMKALAHEPGKRYRTALEMARSIESHLGQEKIIGIRERLRRLVSGEPDAAVAPARIRAPRRRRRRIVPLAAAGLVVTAAVAFFALEPDRLEAIRTRMAAMLTPNPAAPPSDALLAGDQGAAAGVSITALDEPAVPPTALLGSPASDTSSAVPTDTAAVDTALVGALAPPADTISDTAARSAAEAATGDMPLEKTVQMRPRARASEPPAPAPEPVAKEPIEPKQVERPREPVPATGFIDITVDPPAEITINGIPKAFAARYGPRELAAGLHEVVIRRDGYREYTETVTIQRGELSKRSIVLSPVTGGLVFATEAGAAVYIDGTYRATTPLTQAIRLSVGMHRVELRKVGFTTWKSEVYIPLDETLSLSIALTPM